MARTLPAFGFPFRYHRTVGQVDADQARAEETQRRYRAMYAMGAKIRRQRKARSDAAPS